MVAVKSTDMGIMVYMYISSENKMYHPLMNKKSKSFNVDMVAVKSTDMGIMV